MENNPNEGHAPTDVDTGWGTMGERINEDDPRFNDHIDAMNKQAMGPEKDLNEDPNDPGPSKVPHISVSAPKPPKTPPGQTPPIIPPKPTQAQTIARHVFHAKGE